MKKKAPRLTSPTSPRVHPAPLGDGEAKLRTRSLASRDKIAKIRWAIIDPTETTGGYGGAKPSSSEKAISPRRPGLAHRLPDLSLPRALHWMLYSTSVPRGPSCPVCIHDRPHLDVIPSHSPSTWLLSSIYRERPLNYFTRGARHAAVSPKNIVRKSRTYVSVPTRGQNVQSD